MFILAIGIDMLIHVAIATEIALLTVATKGQWLHNKDKSFKVITKSLFKVRLSSHLVLSHTYCN